MAFREVTHTSWGKKMGGAVFGAFLGILLFGAAFPLLFWNEGRAVKRAKSLKEGLGIVASLSAERVDSEYEGALVHLSGPADTQSVLQDPDFQVSVKALRLQRRVQMYQWKEHKQTKKRDKIGGGTETVTTYTYEKQWSDSPIDSSRFKEQAGHQNPSGMAYRSTTLNAPNVSLGAYRLSTSLIRKIKNFEPLALTQAPNLPGQTMHLRGGDLYLGQNPASPAIGDLKISYKAAYPTEFSIVARQSGDILGPYSTRFGDTIELLKTGVFTADAMFEAAQQENAIMTWAIRGGGFFAMLMGLFMIFGVFGALASVLPPLARFVRFGIRLAAIPMAAGLSITTISIAWVTVRPLLGIPLLIGAIACVVVSVGVLRQKR